MYNKGGIHIDGLFWTEPVHAGLFDEILGVKRVVQVQTVPFEGPNSSKMGWDDRPSVTN